MIDLKTQYAGLQLKSPIIVGSSGLTRNPNKSKELEDAGAGAIVLKSLFEEQIEIQIDQVSKTSDYYPEAEDYLRSYMK
ncbi:MAG: diguanylate cyclase, partial [Bacteroidaceae bacterium]|nr:diguanylate cyclase [Bacteroidaceae bacterium]